MRYSLYSYSAVLVSYYWNHCWDEKKQDGLKIADKGARKFPAIMSKWQREAHQKSTTKYECSLQQCILWLCAIWLHHIIANQLLREREECAAMQYYSALSWSTSSQGWEGEGGCSHWMAYFSSMALSTWTTTLNKHPQKRET